MLFTITAVTGGLDAAQVAVLDLQTVAFSWAAGWRCGPLVALAQHGRNIVRVRSGTMGLIWIGLAVAAAVGLAVAMMRLAARGEHTSADVDVGSVSEAWLSEHRAGKES